MRLPRGEGEALVDDDGVSVGGIRVEFLDADTLTDERRVLTLGLHPAGAAPALDARPPSRDVSPGRSPRPATRPASADSSPTASGSPSRSTARSSSPDPLATHGSSSGRRT